MHRKHTRATPDVTSYRHPDPPGVLRLLAKIARDSGRGVELVWIDGDEDVREGAVRVVGCGRDWLRVSPAPGVESTIDSWCVVGADLMGAETAVAA